MTQNERRIDQRRQWRENEAHDIETLKDKLAAEYKLERNEKFEKAWSIAWSYGHSGGLREVENYFHDLAELLK